MESLLFFKILRSVASQDIYNILGILGFLLSASMAILALLRSREDYSIDVIDYANRNTDIVQFLIIITNKSSSPLAISSITYEGTVCELEPKKIRGEYQHFGFVSTPFFPVCIDPHSCRYIYLEFLDMPYIPLSRGTTVNFQIQSTRKLAHKTVLLGEISHYLHSRG